MTITQFTKKDGTPVKMYNGVVWYPQNLDEEIEHCQSMIMHFQNEIQCEIDFHSKTDKFKMKYWTDELSSAKFKLARLLNEQPGN